MRPHEDSNIGERVTLVGDNLFGEAGLSQEFQAVLNPKRKIEPKLLEKLISLSLLLYKDEDTTFLVPLLNQGDQFVKFLLITL